MSWQARDPQRRAAGLVLEVKGDFCHDIRQILAESGREEDYIELGMDGSWQWNPLSAEWLDSYSLAYTVSSLLNQLFGKGKEPFWQQAYTNLVRWIIELYRVFPGQWVTLQQVYHCAIDKELFAAKIKEAEDYVRDLREGTVWIAAKDYTPNITSLRSETRNGFRHTMIIPNPTSRTTTPRLRPGSKNSRSNMRSSGPRA